jgi:uncharacterized protein YdiU (UPF0061 family)
VTSKLGLEKTRAFFFQVLDRKGCPMFQFENTFAKLPKDFYHLQSPSRVPNPRLIIFNHKLAENLGGDAQVEDSLLPEVFSGNKVLEGSEPLAQAYAGHQFAHFVPQLGDGRALLLGEVRDRQGQLWDVQLKGSGPTPFSRRGDGKSSLGPVLREYLLSEWMHRVGVPTTRALAAVLTGETVFREEELPGAVFTRVAPSHIRVGTFEFFASRRDAKNLRTLFEYTLKRHFPEMEDLDSGEQQLLAFFREVMLRQADLVARWMSLGFIHGVMNTDNCSVPGVTIDYGPCAFMDHYEASRVYSFIDRQGRYAYNRQPSIAQWNLSCLAEALLLLTNFSDSSVASFNNSLAEFPSEFEARWLRHLGAKLGLTQPEDKDLPLLKSWFELLQDQKQDFTLSFRGLSKTLIEDPTDKGSSVLLIYKAPEFLEFYKAWKSRLEEQGESPLEVQKRMDSLNPLYIPRNHIVEEVIERGIKGDFQPFHSWLEVLQNPFEEQQSQDRYALPPEPNQVVANTFCGT